MFLPQSTMNGGQSVVVTSSVSDVLDLGRSYATATYAGLGVPIRFFNTNDYGPNFTDLLVKGTQTSDYTFPFFVRRIDGTTPNTTTNGTPGNPNVADNFIPISFDGFVSDAAGNQATQNVVVPNGNVEAGNAIGADANLVSWTFENTAITIHISPGAGQTNEVTLQAIARGTTGVLQNPCTHGTFFGVRDANGDQKILGLGSQRNEDDGAERRWIFELLYTADGDLNAGPLPAAQTFLAICTSTSGDGLATFNIQITVDN